MKILSLLSAMAVTSLMSVPSFALEMKLKNGATMDVEQDSRSPRQRLTLVFQGGSSLFSPEEQGVAPILLNILELGPSSLSTVDYNRELFQLGAQVEYGISSRAAFVQVTAKPDQLEKTLDLVLETLKSPKFDKDSYTMARSKLEAAVARREDDMRSTLRYFAIRDAFKYHPDVMDGSTTQVSLKKIDLKKVQDGLPKLLNPESLIFGSVGPDTPEHVKTVVESKVVGEGGLRAKAFQARAFKSARADEKPSGKHKVTVLNRPGATDNQVYYLTRRNLPLDNQDMASLDVANYLLGASSNSILNKVLREQRGLTYGVGSGLQPNLGYFAVVSFASTDKIVPLIQGIEEVVGKQAQAKASKEETELAKGELLTSWKERRELPADRLNEAITAKLYGRNQDFVTHYDRAIGKVSDLDINQSAQRFFNLKNANVYLMGDKTKLVPLLKKMGYKDNEIRVVETSQIL